MKVKVTVILEVNALSHDECESILHDMDYSFSKVELENGIGKTLTEVDKIESSEITEWEIR